MPGELAAPFTMAVDHVCQLPANGVPDPSTQAPTVPARTLWHCRHHLQSTDERLRLGTSLAVKAPPPTPRSPVSSRAGASVGSAVGARSEVQDVAEVRGQVSMIGVAEVAGHRRDIDA